MTIIETDTLSQDKDSDDYSHGFFDIAEVDGQRYLLSQYLSGGMILSTLGANGALDYLDTVATYENPLESYRVFGTATFTSQVLNDRTLYYIAGGVLPNPSALEFRYATMVAELSANGKLDVVQVVGTNSTPATFREAAEAPEIARVGDTSFLVLPGKDLAANNDRVVETRVITSDGTLGRATESSWGRYDKAEFDTFDVAHVGQRAFLVWEGWGQTGSINVAQIRSDGTIHNTDIKGPQGQIDQTSKLNGLTAVETDEGTFVYGAGYRVIRGYEVSSKGQVEQIEIERNPDIDGVLSGYYDLHAFELDGKHYLAAAGNTGGIVVYDVADNGALMLNSTDVASSGSEHALLDSVSGDKGEQLIVRTTSGDVSYHSFRFIPEDWDVYGTTNGNDLVRGTVFDDYIYGLGGRDRLFGSDGDDNLIGGSGRDLLTGQAHNDNLSGGGMRDVLKGGSGDDFLRGDGGSDKLLGGSGEDHLRGGAGRDVLKGNGSTDWLYGDSGNDLLAGGDGDDKITDGSGRDKLQGGDGKDTFILVRDNNRDVIADFEDEVDLIDISRWQDDLEFVDLKLTQAGKSVLVSLGNEKLTIKSASSEFDLLDLSGGDFLF